MSCLPCAAWRSTPPAAIGALGTAVILFCLPRPLNDGSAVAAYGMTGAIALLFAASALELAVRPARRGIAIAVALVLAGGAVVLADNALGGVHELLLPIAHPGFRDPFVVAAAIALPAVALVVNAFAERHRSIEPPASTPHGIAAATLATRGFGLAATGTGVFGLLGIALAVNAGRVFNRGWDTHLMLAAGVALAVGTAGLGLAGIGLARLVSARLAHVRSASLLVGATLVTLAGSLLALKAVVAAEAARHPGAGLARALDIAQVGRGSIAISLLAGTLLALMAVGRYSLGPRFVDAKPRLDGRTVAFLLLGFVATLTCAAAEPFDHLAVTELSVAALCAAGAFIFAARIFADTATTLRYQFVPPPARVI
ncbi:MAG TPA: hypothetical protein VGM88_26495 [Kofleriaceae bacterium]|jgi:hypothetical protein